MRIIILALVALNRLFQASLAVAAEVVAPGQNLRRKLNTKFNMIHSAMVFYYDGQCTTKQNVNRDDVVVLCENGNKLGRLLAEGISNPDPKRLKVCRGTDCHVYDFKDSTNVSKIVSEAFGMK